VAVTGSEGFVCYACWVGSQEDKLGLMLLDSDVIHATFELIYKLKVEFYWVVYLSSFLFLLGLSLDFLLLLV
jgi:hypothetical protein